MRKLALALLTLAALESCGDADRDTPRIRSRAAALRYMPLPGATDEPGPPGVYVNTLVKTLRIASEPSGAVLSIDGKALGTTPCAVPVDDLLGEPAASGAAGFRLLATVGGETRPVARYVLRFEAANVNAGVDPESIPSDLQSADRWLYLVLRGAPR